MKIKIVDFFSINTFHEVFNLSLLSICANIGDKVIYKTSVGYGKNINSKLLSIIHKVNLSKICIKSKPTLEYDSKFGALMRHLIGFWICLWEYLILAKNSLLIFNYTNYFSLPIILLLNRFLDKKIIFTIHGELGLVEQKIPKLKTSWFFKHIIKFSFKYLLLKSNGYILVLGNSIKRNLLGLYPKLSNNIIAICHPVIAFSSGQYKTKKQHREKLTIGTVGIMNKAKGVESLIQLSNLLKDEIISGKLELRCIGKVYEEDISKYPLIKWIHSEEMLSRDLFEQSIRDLDFILFLYNKNSYKFCASGALFDSLICRTPLIALHNDYFDDVLSDVEIGYLLPSIESIADLILNLEHGYKEDLKFDVGFERLETKTSITGISSIFKKQLIERNLL